ncbi:MAG: aminotransferase class I/II-fold pyridoxal phosphate-dependent enzyme, partial [Clostridia bacterium]|nr:aminotransferase class I/II-fold pyridoxal phosphate-dependent enzyme [Clostridia bacterium]
MVQVSQVMTNVHSDIRGETYYRALELEKAGQKVLKLNTGNPATFGFEMPRSVRRCIEENAEKALGYCDVRGMAAAREAIRDYHRARGIRDAQTDDVFIGNGVSEIAAMLTTVSLNEGDEVLVPMPCYSLWVNQIVMVKAKPVFYRCDEKAEWCPDIADMRLKVTAKTRAVLLINPNNPTGAVYGETLLREVIGLAREHGLVIWSDEIYDRLMMEGTPYTSIASLCDDVPMVTMNGLSKSHCLCGLRCGWMVLSGPRSETASINRALTTLASVRL